MARKIVIRATRHAYTSETSAHHGCIIIKRVVLDKPPVAKLSGAAAMMLRWSMDSSLAGSSRPLPPSSTAPAASFYSQEA